MLVFKHSSMDLSFGVLGAAPARGYRISLSETNCATVPCFLFALRSMGGEFYACYTWGAYLAPLRLTMTNAPIIAFLFGKRKKSDHAYVDYCIYAQM
jgi:hypothetical protein